MKYIKYFVLVVAFAIWPISSLGQEKVSAPNFLSIFGKRVDVKCRTEAKLSTSSLCEVYNYGDDFLVQINRNEKQEIVGIDLYLKTEGGKSKFTFSDQEKFVSKIKRFRQIGHLKLSGPFIYLQSLVQYGRKYDHWEFYEGAFIVGFYAFFDAKRPRLTSLTVLFPTEIAGRIDDIREVSPNLEPRKGGIPLISVNGCSYFTYNRAIKIGTEGVYSVVEPRGDKDENCKKRGF